MADRDPFKPGYGAQPELSDDADDALDDHAWLDVILGLLGMLGLIVALLFWGCTVLDIVM